MAAICPPLAGGSNFLPGRKGRGVKTLKICFVKRARVLTVYKPRQDKALRAERIRDIR